MVKKSGHHGHPHHHHHHHHHSYYDNTDYSYLNSSNYYPPMETNLTRVARYNEQSYQEKLECEWRETIAAHQKLLPALAHKEVSISSEQLWFVPELPEDASMPTIPGTTETLLSWVIKSRNLELFDIAVNYKGYRLCQLSSKENNPLLLIAQNAYPFTFLNRVRNKVTADDADYLINLIMLNQNEPSSGVNQGFDILTWLLEQNLVGHQYSTRLNQLAVERYKANDLSFANTVFSCPTIDAFCTLRSSTRQSIITQCSKDGDLFNNELLLKWYSDSCGTFHAQKFFDDMVELRIDVKLVHQTINLAASQRKNFEELKSNAFAVLLDPLIAGGDSLIWPHLINKQPQLLSVVPSEEKSRLFNMIKMVYEQTKHSPEKELVAFARTAFEQAPSAEAVVDFASKLEFDWKHDNHFSAKSIEVMLKLAKINVLSRLKAQSDAPSEKLESFLGKHRTTYHFLCLPFHLTLFSTTSTKTYNLRKNASEFNQAVDKDVAAGQAEYQAFMR